MSEIEKFLFNTSFDEAALTQDKANAKAVEEEAAKNEAEEIARPTFQKKNSKPPSAKPLKPARKRASTRQLMPLKHASRKHWSRSPSAFKPSFINRLQLPQISSTMPLKPPSPSSGNVFRT